MLTIKKDNAYLMLRVDFEHHHKLFGSQAGE